MKKIVPISVNPDGLLSQLIDAAPDAILTLDVQGKIKLASSRAVKMMGYSREELTARTLKSLAKDSSLNIAQSLNGRAIPVDLLKKNGELLAAEITFGSFQTPEGEYISAFIRDIGSRMKLENDLKKTVGELRDTNDKLRKLSEIDPLTEALNRRGFERILNRERERTQRDGTNISIAMMDLDNLKSINEKFGHLGGDSVLKEIARRTAHALRSTDYLARIGGDEFVILYPSTDLNEAVTVTERVRSEIAATEVLPEFCSTVSCGVIQLSIKARSLEELLPLLRNALKKSKDSGKNCVSVSSFQRSSTFTKKINLEEMHEILETGLSVASDAIFSLEDKVMKAIEFHIRGPQNLLHTPVEVLQAASDLNMLSHADLACAQVCARHAKNISDHLPVHLNILPSTLESVPTKRLIEILEPVIETRIACVEISVLRINADPGYLIEPIKELKDFGIQIALDDVCFGRTSLEALIVMEPTFIKLDRHFVFGLSRDNRRQNAVKRLLKMARVVGVEVIAEGIETEDDYAMLKYLGVGLGQGFLFQKN